MLSMDLESVFVKDVIELKRWLNIKSTLSSDPSKQDPTNSQHAYYPQHCIWWGGAETGMLLGAWWLPVQLQVPCKTLSQRNKAESHRAEHLISSTELCAQASIHIQLCSRTPHLIVMIIYFIFIQPLKFHIFIKNIFNQLRYN